jgi:hypothetical protein
MGCLVRGLPGPPWDGWRTILKAAFALPMSADERAFFRTLADRDPPRRQVREWWIVAGRRARKSYVKSFFKRLLPKPVLESL